MATVTDLTGSSVTQTMSKNPLLEVVMIVRNEEELLPRCLNSVKGVDSIIITDTGSTDSTKEIASKYTDKIYDFPGRLILQG